MHRANASTPLALLVTLIAIAIAPPATLRAAETAATASIQVEDGRASLLPARVVQSREYVIVAEPSAVPELTEPEYVLPVMEVRALRTLREPDLPLTGWFDDDPKGVYRYWAEGATARLAVDIAWLNPFNW